MARGFSTDQFVSVASAPITAAPLTMTCWFQTTDDNSNQGLLFLGDQGSDNDHWGLYATSAAHISFRATDTSSYSALTLNDLTADTWHFAAGVEISTSSRRAYLDTTYDAETTSCTPTPGNIDTFAIGAWRRSTDGLFLSGRVAEVGLWDVALTEQELAVLAAGYSPLCVRPGNLVLYCPLTRDDDEDLVGGLSLGATNSPTIASHSPVIYPVDPQVVTAPAASLAAFPPIIGKRGLGLVNAYGGSILQ